MTDVPSTPRRAMSQMRRLRIFEAHGGRCVLCEQRIQAGDTWTVEHLRALALGGADEDDNCGPAHEQCRRAKDKADVKAIAKAKRMKIKHYGGDRHTRSFGRTLRKPDGFEYDWKQRRYVKEAP